MVARAQAKGTKLGRRPVKPAIEARIRELKAEGMGILKIGRTLARSCQRERRRNRCASNLGVRDIGGG